MRRTFSMIGLLSLTAMLWGGVMTPVAYAAESDDFSAPDNGPQAAAMDAGSDDYSMVGSMTWYAEGESDDYTTGVGDAEEEDDDEGGGGTSGGASSSTATDDGQGGGGRGAGTNVTATVASRMSQASTSRSTSSVPSRTPVLRPAATRPQRSTVIKFHQFIQAVVLPVTPAEEGQPTVRFFDVVDPACPVCVQRDCPVTPRTNYHQASTQQTKGEAHNALLRTMMFLTGAMAMVTGRSHFTPRRNKKGRTNRLHRTAGSALTALGLLLILTAVITPLADSVIIKAHAEDTVPQYRIYNGQLRNGQGQAITTPHTIRFSYWNTSNAVPSDLTATGSINVNAPQFLGWQEFHTVTPNAQGNFFVKLGANTSLGEFESLTPQDAQNLHLQVEVKPDGAPYSSFQILDVNRSNDLIDRTAVLAVPSARNADLLDLRDVGTGSGAIPYLLSGGLLPVSTIPGATNRDTFVLDANNSAPAEIALQFGGALTEKLSYDKINTRFVFSDDLRVEGDLTVTGLINGVDVTSLTEASATHLKVSSGAGLDVDIAGGNFQLNGDITNFDGDSGVTVPNNATSYVFFGSGGLTIRSMEFPTDESFIPLAQVVSSGGSIQSVEDLRVLQSDNRENTVLKTFNATFENASYQGDGADNVGQLYTSHDNANLKNFYVWTTTRTALQDYDIIQRVSLPAGFVRWDTAGASNPLTVTYRTTNASVANAKLDIQVYDTNGVPVTLSGSVLGLTSATWATTQIEFSGSPTWTAGQEFLIRFKSSAKDNFQVHIGDFRLRMVEMLGDH